MNPDLQKAILAKTAHQPDKMLRAKAAVIYLALSRGVCDSFTADEIPKELVSDSSTAGCAIASVRALKLIQPAGYIASPAKSRHGAVIRRWTLALFDGTQRAKEWLRNNGFKEPLDPDTPR